MLSKEEAIPTSVFDADRHAAELGAGYEDYTGAHRPAFLFVDRGPGAGQLVPVKAGSLVIGRASISDLRLQHGSISRRHAQLSRKGGRFYIKDLGSQNGTYVNRMRIATELEVFPGDQIALGNALLKLRGPKEQAAAAAQGQPDRSYSSAQLQRARKGTGFLRVALFGGAVGFGLATVVMVALFVLPHDPSYQAAQAPSARAAQPGEALKEPAGNPAADPVSEKISKLMADRAKANEAEASGGAKAALKAPKDDAEAKRTAGEPKTAKVAAAKPGKDAEAAPAPAAGSKRAAILARYEAGDVGSALAMAKEQGENELSAKLSSFQARYDKAQDALGAQDLAGAITAFKSALDLDKKMSSGASKYGTEIRRELSGLAVLAGQHYLKTGNTELATKWLESALTYSPQNANAKAELARLKNGGGPIDDKAARADPDEEMKPKFKSGEEEPPVKPTAKPKGEAKPKANRSSLDDAFNE